MTPDILLATIPALAAALSGAILWRALARLVGLPDLDDSDDPRGPETD